MRLHDCVVSLSVLLASACLFCCSVMAQNISSSVKGLILDPSGAPVPEAACVLTEEATGVVTRTTSNAEGAFTFPSVLPGTYRLRIQAKGFKSLERKAIIVTASEIRTLGNVRLDIGEVVESVTVSDQGTPLQLASAEKSGLLTSQQINQIAVKGRDLFALLSTVPGVVDTSTSGREAPTPQSTIGIIVNGGRDTQKNIAVDGQTDMDTGSNQGVHYQPNMDAIAEIKILTSNYQAEFGRNSGGLITIVTKSGTKQFHGSAYDFYRHESLNANSFFNNRTNTPKAPYRYRISGYSLGGPVYIPGKFNKGREKLFFFWSQEFTGIKKDYGTIFANTPTAAERIGDYSGSFDVNGRLIAIRDPQTGTAFPQNVIPQSRLSPLGKSIVGFFPSPNYVDPDPTNRYRWNLRSTYSGNYPKRQELIRIDWNARPNLQIFWRYVQDKDEQDVPYSNWITGSVNFLLTPVAFGMPGRGHLFHVTNTFSPTLTNEFSFGKSRNEVYDRFLDPSLVDRGKMGNPPQWYADPTSNPTNYYPGTNPIPNVSFGSQPVTAVNGTLNNRLPSNHFNDLYSWVDNVSKVWRSHTFKAGFYIETSRQMGWSDSNYKGTFNFGIDSNNPLNTGHGFANAVLGNITSYSETTSRVFADARFWNFEWYIQDNWRVTSRVTLDFGLRLYHQPPMWDANRTIAGFDPSAFNAAKAPVLYMPARDATGLRVAQNPLTGALAFTPLIGQYVPGSGDFANGMRVGGKDGYPDGLYKLPWLALGPRFGFAYDVFGTGKTALRGGFGIFMDRPDGNPTYGEIGNPPVAFTPTLYYGTLDTYAQGGGALGPSTVRSLYGSAVPSPTMNYSFGIQQRIGNMTAEASYVGSLARHLLMGRDINPIPMYAHFDPKNADPTQPTLPLPDNFLRPYRGYGSLNMFTFDGTSNYHALQTSLNRRFTRAFQFGVSYAWSKVLGVASSEGTTVSPYFPARQRNYGALTQDRSHVFVLNYVYSTPKLSTRLGWKPLAWVLDSWELSGITSFISGAPFTPGFSTTDGQDITGSSEGARINVVGDPQLSKGDKTFFRNFNTSVFRRPAKGDFGNAGVSILRGPGINNWDVSVSKRFPIKSDARFLQFRTEMFNAWNHAQFSGLYTTARFDTAGNQVDPNFGAFSSARFPRIVQLSLKFYF